MVERAELERLFAAHGVVRSVRLIDPPPRSDNGGTWLVEMDSEEHGEAAIGALNGTEQRGFALGVHWAQPEKEKCIDLSRMFERIKVRSEHEGPKSSVLREPALVERGRSETITSAAPLTGDQLIQAANKAADERTRAANMTVDAALQAVNRMKDEAANAANRAADQITSAVNKANDQPKP